MKKIILTTSLLLMVILTGCGQKLVKSTNNLNTPNNNLSVTPDYQTYVNEQLNYSLKYLANWQVVETDNNSTVSLYPPVDQSAVSYLTITAEKQSIEEIAKTYQNDVTNHWLQEPIVLNNISGTQFISENDANTREIYLPTNKPTDAAYYHLFTHKYSLLTVQNILNSFVDTNK